MNLRKNWPAVIQTFIAALMALGAGLLYVIRSENAVTRAKVERIEPKVDEMAASVARIEGALGVRRTSDPFVVSAKRGAQP